MAFRESAVLRAWTACSASVKVWGEMGALLIVMQSERWRRWGEVKRPLGMEEAVRTVVR